MSLDYVFDIPQAVPSDDDLRPAVLEAIHRTAARAGLRSAPRSVVLGEAMRNLNGKANPTQVLKIIDEEMEP